MCMASVLGVIILPMVSNAVFVHALKGLALPRASHSGEIALAGLHRLRSTLVAAPVLFTRAVVTEMYLSACLCTRAFAGVYARMDAYAFVCVCMFMCNCEPLLADATVNCLPC